MWIAIITIIKWNTVHINSDSGVNLMPQGRQRSGEDGSIIKVTVTHYPGYVLIAF